MRADNKEFLKIYRNQTPVLFSQTDIRDYLFSSPHPSELPLTIDLRKWNKEIEDQGHVGSCVANAGVNVFEILYYRHFNKQVDFSRLFLYWILRAPYKDLCCKDSGAYLRDVFKAPAKQGICLTAKWPYIEDKKNIKPTEEAFKEALNHKVQEYRKINGYKPIYGTGDLYAITLTKIALAQGFPVAIAMTITYDLFYLVGALNKQNYVGTLEKGYKEAGGHAMTIVGYDDNLGGFIVENSWGSNWGDKGYWLLKYEVAVNDIREAWVCTKFNGIEFKPLWERDKPLTNYETKVYNVNYYELPEDKIIELECSVEGGYKPFDYTWKVAPTEGMPMWYFEKVYPEADKTKCKVEIGKPLDDKYLNNKNELEWRYVTFVTDNGNPKLKVAQYHKVIVNYTKPEPKPKPKPIKPKPEPKPKPKPIKPKPEHKQKKKKLSKNYTYIFIAVLLILIYTIVKG
jgi:C1A family cysteine protease